MCNRLESFYYSPRVLTRVLFWLNILKVLFDSENFWVKIEISFDSIDQLIRVDTCEESLNLYVPCKRAPFLFKAEKGIDKVNLKTIDEKYVNWTRYCSFNAGWSYKFNFKPEEKLMVLSAFQKIPGNRILFGPVSIRRTDYNLNDLRRDFVWNDFKSRYALEAFMT